MNKIIRKICFSLLILQCTFFSLSALDDDDSAFALAALNTDADDTENSQDGKETEPSDAPASEQRISEKSYAKIKDMREALVKLLGSSRFTTTENLTERLNESISNLESLKETMIHEGDFIENSSKASESSSLKKDDIKKLVAAAVQETLMNNAHPMQATVNAPLKPNTSPSFIAPIFSPLPPQATNQMNQMQPQQNMNMNSMQQPMNNFMQQPIQPQQNISQMQGQSMDQYNIYPTFNPIEQTTPAPQQSFMQSAQPFPATPPAQITPAKLITSPVQNNATALKPSSTSANLPEATPSAPLTQEIQYSDEGFPMDVPLDQIDQFLLQNDQSYTPGQ